MGSDSGVCEVGRARVTRKGLRTPNCLGREGEKERGKTARYLAWRPGSL